MRALMWLRSLYAWETVLDTGVWRYEVNRVTWARRVRRVGGGHQPVYRGWLRSERFGPGLHPSLLTIRTEKEPPMAARRELVPADPALTVLDKGSLNYKTIEALALKIGGRVRATPMLLNIFSALATGHLPWGVAWPSGLTRDGNGWVLCCGHTLGFAKAQDLVSAGLLREELGDGVPDRLVITEAGRTWLAQNWPS